MDFHSTNKWIKVTRFRLLCYPRTQATAHHDVRSPISPLCANSANTTTCVSAKTSVNCFSGHVQCFGLCVYPVSSILSGGHLWKALKKFPTYLEGTFRSRNILERGFLYLLLKAGRDPISALL